MQVSPDLPGGVLVRGRVVVHAKPKDRLAALRPSTTSLVIGNEIVLVRGAGGIKIGDVLTIADQVHRSYHQVTGVFDPRVTFDRAVGELRFDSASVSPVVSVDAEARTAAHRHVHCRGCRRLAAARQPDRRRSARVHQHAPAALHGQLSGLHADDSAAHGRGRRRQDGAAPDPHHRRRVPRRHRGSSPFTGASRRRQPMDHRPAVRGQGQRRITTTLPRTTVGGDFVVAITGSSLAWGAVSSITRDEPARQASIAPVSPWQRTSGDLLLGATTVFGHFTKQLRLAGWNSNPTPISGSDIPLDLPAETASLTIGRKLVVYRSDATDRGYLTAVSAVTGGTLRLRDGISDGAGFTRENLRIAGNVACEPRRASGREGARLGRRHAVGPALRARTAGGLVRPGSEAAARRARRHRRRGRRADLGQVGTLRDVGPADSVYAVRSPRTARSNSSSATAKRGAGCRPDPITCGCGRASASGSPATCRRER